MQPDGSTTSNTVTVFLAGDVMTGRGIDQILGTPSSPELHEPWVTDARRYVQLAERVNGPIPRGVEPDYVWGDALGVLDRRAPDARIVNLETTVTRSDAFWRDKGIHYRMHPDNGACLTAAGIDCCTLANNHVLDWGCPGLTETLATLHRLGLHTAGAGRTAAEAEAPATFTGRSGARVQVVACGTGDSGIAACWRAGTDSPGVNRLPDLSPATADRVAAGLLASRWPGDVVVLSIHWGGNWVRGVDPAQRAFAHRLIDRGAVDIVHGHSSHHARGIEVYRNRPILYGCGDLLNDYEGIGAHAGFVTDVVPMYFVTLDAAGGELAGLELVPMRLKRFRLRTATRAESAPLAAALELECAPLGTRLEWVAGGEATLAACWTTAGQGRAPAGWPAA